MSDPAAEPGAPTGGATDVPPASEKSIAAEVKKKVPEKAVTLARTPDRIILRLNKYEERRDTCDPWLMFARLLASPGGLSSFLSTFNYTLYLLIYLESKSAPLQAQLYALLSRLSGKPASSVVTAGVAGPSRIAALATLLGQTRTTLRLFGLFPMYAWLRQLLQGPKPGQDQVLYTTSLTQCTLYITFQFLENVALLTDKDVLPTSYTTRWHATGGASKTSKMYLWAYRAWMAGFCCDFVRLAREAQLTRQKRSGEKGVAAAATAEEKEADQKWWSELAVPMSWFPVGAQFSTVGGLPGFNLGIMGLCGMLAGLGRTSALWVATAED